MRCYRGLLNSLYKDHSTNEEVRRKIQAIHLKRLRDVKHKSTSLMFLKDDTVDTIFKLKTSKGINLLAFKCCDDSCFSAKLLTML